MGGDHDRPVSWACKQQNWPPHLCRWAKPSSTTMSRRLRSPAVMELLQLLEQDVLRAGEAGALVWLMDGKPLAISGVSKDRQAGYGRAARGKAKGYKLHAVVSASGQVAQWRVAPMNKDERVMGERMLRSAQLQGYVVADANYDSNPLHRVCDERGNCQLLTPRRYGPGRGVGHRRQTAGRLRSIALLEEPFAQFGQGLLHQRGDIERWFAHLCNWGGGLTHLPPWARSHRRVHRWVQAKLIFALHKHPPRTATYVA